MKHVLLGWALVAALGSASIGCKDACQSATDRLNARFKECKFPDDSAITLSASAECDAATGAYFDCRADCAESASCATLHGTDPQGAKDFNQCNLDCN